MRVIARNTQGGSVCMGLPNLPPDYRPTEKEPYMSPLQLAYFRNKLEVWKAELLTESEDTLAALQEQSLSTPEAVERASMETDHALELRARDRARKLINKIDKAIARIDVDEYGYCEQTGDPIGLRRLEARPIATMTLEAQEQHEKAEKLHRDDRRMS